MERNQFYVNSTTTTTSASATAQPLDVDQEEIELSEMSERAALALPVVVPSSGSTAITVQLPSSSVSLQRPNGLGFELSSPHSPIIRDNNNYLPSKSEILHYFTQAQKFYVKRINNDMQITDAEGFPLFDAWLDVNLCYKYWRLETYGRTVLLMREPLTFTNDFARPRMVLNDWNGDFFGALIPGDPFILLSTERQPVAKLIPHRSPTVDTVESSMKSSSVLKPCWLCVLEGSGRHIARLEDYQVIQFNKDVAFHLKLLTLAAIVRLVGQMNPISNFSYVVKYVLNCCNSSNWLVSSDVKVPSSKTSYWHFFLVYFF